MAFVSVVIVSLNGAAVLPGCLRCLEELDWPREQLEIIVVNNGSTDGTRNLLENMQNDRVLALHLPRNLGFAGGNNRGISEASGEWIILLNDDVEVEKNWLSVLMKAAGDNPNAGILGSLLIYPDRKTVQHAGGIVEPNGLSKHIGVGEENTGQYDSIRECQYVTGAAFAIRRDLLKTVGLLDAGYWPIYFEEIDYCFRARRAGYQVLCTPALAVHHESRTTVAHSSGFLKKYHRNRLRFAARNLSFNTWLRAEWRWWRQTWRWLQWRILFVTYLTMLPRLPGLWTSRRR